MLFLPKNKVLVKGEESSIRCTFVSLLSNKKVGEALVSLLVEAFQITGLSCGDDRVNILLCPKNLNSSPIVTFKNTR